MSERSIHATVEYIKDVSRMAVAVSVEDAERVLESLETEIREAIHVVWWHKAFLRAFVEYRRKLEELAAEC